MLDPSGSIVAIMAASHLSPERANDPDREKYHTIIAQPNDQPA
jgi:hypothetical protein